MKIVALFAVAVLAASATAQTTGPTKVEKAPFGKLPDGNVVDVYTLTDKQLTVRVITFGAHIASVMAPDKKGNVTDVVLGYKDLGGYLLDNKTYLGSVVGRYGNRIGKGKFSLGGKQFQLDTNNNGNTLHGGTTGFDRLNWTGKQVANGVELTVVSPDGDMGFPGKLTAHVTYTLAGDKLKISYSATTDKPTVVNLTQHTYFNLAGHGTILEHMLTIDADKYTPTDALSIPEGPLATVAGTPFDFRKGTAIGERVNTPNEQLKRGGGYDHNWVLNGPHTLAKAAAVVTDPASGRQLKVFTVEPGVQFYGGNFLDGTFKGRDGAAYVKSSGLCLETQHYPDSPNRPDFPSTTLLPGKTYRTTTVFEFTNVP
jgi:aldose 1-epimerase